MDHEIIDLHDTKWSRRWITVYADGRLTLHEAMQVEDFDGRRAVPDAQEISWAWLQKRNAFVAGQAREAQERLRARVGAVNGLV
jgi:hypothetical protein